MIVGVWVAATVVPFFTFNWKDFFFFVFFIFVVTVIVQVPADFAVMTPFLLILATLVLLDLNVKLPVETLVFIVKVFPTVMVLELVVTFFNFNVVAALAVGAGTDMLLVAKVTADITANNFFLDIRINPFRSYFVLFTCYVNSNVYIIVMQNNRKILHTFCHILKKFRIG